VHSFCLELMPDFQPTSEVTYYTYLFFDQAYSSLLIMILATPLQNTVPAPRARAIAYLCLGIQVHNSGSADGQICYNGPYSHQLNL
jgi:hypothetical protein